MLLNIRFLEVKMPRTNLGSMSVEALLKLRDDVGKVLGQKAVQLEEQLSKLGGEAGSGRRGRGSAMKGKKVPIKYRDKEGNTWAGRGAQPVWLREKLKAGAKLEDFAVQNTAASRKASPRKAKKRRKK
jgi:H-NS histone family protein